MTGVEAPEGTKSFRCTFAASALQLWPAELPHPCRMLRDVRVRMTCRLQARRKTEAHNAANAVVLCS